jgi:ribA/ribD-fused uncharacterized protein
MDTPRDLHSLRNAVKSGATPRYIHFWGHRVDPAGPGPTCMSQWYPCPFVVDGTRYATAEHWMMAEKARLFGDEQILAQIVGGSDPKRAKSLGRKVRGFDATTWLEHRVDIVVRGNVHKFRAHEPLRRYLLGTTGAVLVEASPYDKIWGIGMGAADPRAMDAMQWQGLNLLGFALMDVREQV